ncbi:YdiU family protein [Aestuariibacter sp. P117]|uniref:Protein nucleotidyltransferase YdiU n=1 Tax=Glaciecola petra TaxID=3075602 RepID=A0ABU2ZSV9_9ALTE|nr:YdiU family protein [Aestuariibacter sp. P117]MDT0595690.1 YdiU family protein [Aestuariibacter sp. P117]
MRFFYAQELSSLSSVVKPFPVSQPRLSCVNNTLVKELGLSNLINNEDNLLKALFMPDGILQKQSIAQKYGGHQFGHWNPQLGDGRGLLLAQVETTKSDLVDLHLKGAGPTPYSRHADGRAVLRSTIREYLGSEAVHHLGIPSSRSLALISSKEPVMRENLERGAMMIRTCPSHIRFGHFEYFFHNGEFEKLDALFEYCFKYHFAHLADTENPHLALLSEICSTSARMIAHWQAYGFNHGVMNTDNMSIHGITFDYGPYAFLDDFISNYICNKSDHSGRYAFEQQPSIGLWNLNALAHAFSRYLSIDQIKQALSIFEPTFLDIYHSLMAKRLGLNNHNNIELSQNFVKILADEFADYHSSFRELSNSIVQIADGDLRSFSDRFKQKDAMQAWTSKYAREIVRQERSPESTQIYMLDTNPKFILRNHLMQKAIIKAENDDFTAVDELIEVVSRPFAEHPEFEHLAMPPSTKEKGIALSCSS